MVAAGVAIAAQSDTELRKCMVGLHCDCPIRQELTSPEILPCQAANSAPWRTPVRMIYCTYIHHNNRLGLVMLPEYTREELAAGVDRMATEILTQSDIQTPPVDAFAVARALGVAVALDDRQEGRARYVRLSNQRWAKRRATILLRPEPRRERQQWAVAHEIGEHVACHVFAQWGVDPRETAPNAREAVANHLAGRPGCCCRRPGSRPTPPQGIGT